MILVLSKSSNETSTDEVIDWIDSRGASFLRINGADLCGDQPVRLSLPDKQLEIQLEDRFLSLPSQQIGAVWYRRWQNSDKKHPLSFFESATHDSIKATQSILQSIAADTRRASEALFSLLEDKPWLSRPAKTRPNKLQVLALASEAHLDIPRTLVTTKRAHVKKFKDSCKSIIAKALSESSIISIEGKIWATYTVELTDTDIDTLPETFPISMFQEKIEKEYEIRIFLLEDRCFPMAIFSQQDPQTSTDFRRYNFARPNRFVPFSLSGDLHSKVLKLMRSLDLDTASMDLVKSTDGRVVFLEVNPIGQFGMISEPCNYYLEREIADLLIQRDQQRQEANPK